MEQSPKCFPILAPMLVFCGLFGEAQGQEPVAPSDVAIVAVWPASPLETKVALARPVSENQARDLIGRKIVYEARSPSRADLQDPPGALRIAGTRLIDARRTLVLATDPHPIEARYRLQVGQGRSVLKLDYDLSGVEVTWAAGEGGEPAWRGWWPGLDFQVVRKLAAGSVPHEREIASFRQPGRVSFSTQLSLPNGGHLLRIRASDAIEEATLGESEARETATPGSIEFTVQSDGTPQFLTFSVKTGSGATPFALEVTHAADLRGQRTFRPLERDWLLLPWATRPVSEKSDESSPDPAILSGGDPTRGEALFFGDLARCAHCHRAGNRGGDVGPDLTGIVRKGRPDIYMSIAKPSARIAPEYMPYTVATRDGRVLVGVVHAEGPDTIKVSDTNAKTTVLPRAEIEQLRPSATSIMPVGLLAALGPERVRDILAYLAPLKGSNLPGN